MSLHVSAGIGASSGRSIPTTSARVAFVPPGAEAWLSARVDLGPQAFTTACSEAEADADAEGDELLSPTSGAVALMLRVAWHSVRVAEQATKHREVCENEFLSLAERMNMSASSPDQSLTIIAPLACVQGKMRSGLGLATAEQQLAAQLCKDPDRTIFETQNGFIPCRWELFLVAFGIIGGLIE